MTDMLHALYIPGLTFAWGLAFGFSHCIGMCGIFVASYTAQSSRTVDPSIARRGPGWTAHFLFHGGRLISLVTLGTIAGAAGTLSHRWAAAQGAISIIVGLVMLGLALGFAGIVPALRLPEPNLLGAGGGAPRRLFIRVLRSERTLKPLGIGIFVGLLPCGLTYQALIVAAATGSVPRAVLTMAAFCLGTVPGLLTLAVFGATLFGGLLVRPAFRDRMTQVAALIMLAIGVAFLWRGWNGF
ncbi:MAG: sulfite exporter TauE/SafE family protein [Capsulimonadaceae bacterium]